MNLVSRPYNTHTASLMVLLLTLTMTANNSSADVLSGERVIIMGPNGSYSGPAPSNAIPNTLTPREVANKLTSELAALRTQYRGGYGSSRTMSKSAFQKRAYDLAAQAAQKIGRTTANEILTATLKGIPWAVLGPVLFAISSLPSDAVASDLSHEGVDEFGYYNDPAQIEGYSHDPYQLPGENFED